MAADVLAQTVSVVAVIETDPVPNGGDSADDPAIWIHPSDPSSSTIIGTDKSGGLAVYDTSGSEIQYLADGRMNNVDVRYGFRLGGSAVALVSAGNRSDDTIAVYAVDAQSGLLTDVAARSIEVGLTMYGSCMYKSAISGNLYFFANSKSGEVEQWRLFDNGAGQVDAELVRSFDVGGQVEGCVADDELGDFYIGEEVVAIWKYGAEPADGDSRIMVDSAGGSGNIERDIEGLGLYHARNGRGYLIASSQGPSEFVIYEREGSNAFVGKFIVEDGLIDGVSGTDGLDVTNASLGPGLSQGAFVAQDNSNPGANQNFKVVPWESIATAFDPPLLIDPTWNPRQTAPGPKPPSNLTAE